MCRGAKADMLGATFKSTANGAKVLSSGTQNPGGDVSRLSTGADSRVIKRRYVCYSQNRIVLQTSMSTRDQLVLVISNASSAGVIHNCSPFIPTIPVILTLLSRQTA